MIRPLKDLHNNITTVLRCVALHTTVEPPYFRLRCKLLDNQTANSTYVIIINFLRLFCAMFSNPVNA